MSCDFAMTACGSARIFLPVFMQSNVYAMLLEMLLPDITYNKLWQLFHSSMMVLIKWYENK